jgi:catechol 2,3-dioxygenase-like lactoylglutathione lyase family enzyme
MKVLGLDHIVLRVRDMNRMIAFWHDVLGCKVEKVQAELGLVHIRAGTALIDLVDVAGKLGREGGRPPESEGRNLDHVCLRVEPFEPSALLRHLAAHGVSAEQPKRRFGAEGYGDSIYLTDPEGNRIELKGPSPR